MKALGKVGTTAVPLTLVVHSSLMGADAIRALQAAGHTVRSLCGACEQGDLLLGPTCWRIVPELVGYVNLAIQAARKAARPKKGTP